MKIALIANADLSETSIREHVDDIDFVVQFNKCIHASLINIEAHRKCFVFNVPPEGRPHGFDTALSPPCALDGATVYFATTQKCNPYVEQIREQFGGIALNFCNTIGHYDLTKFGFVPSIGYQTATYFALAGHSVRLIGFTGAFRDGGWIGHHFDLERLLLSTHENVEFWPEPAAPDLSIRGAFAGVFGHDYPWGGVGPAVLMVDVAKALWRAGDRVTTRLFLKNAFLRNPGLLRAFNEMAALDDLEERPRVFNKGLVWQHRRNLQTPVDVAAPYQFSAADYGFSIVAEEQKRVLILNNTAALPFNRIHLGCRLVMAEILHQLRAHGMVGVGWLNETGGLLKILQHDSQLRHVDAILVNGEGTFHHAASRAFELLMLAKTLKEEFGKKVFFINGVWQENGSTFRKLADCLDFVAVRDTRSWLTLGRHDDAAICPDLAWVAELGAVAEKSRDLAVIDSVLPDAAVNLQTLSARAAAAFFVMGRYHPQAFDMLNQHGRLPQVLREAADLAPYNAVVSGRYHGAILALRRGCAVVCLPSNSFKIEAMFEDIGLDGKIVSASDAPSSPSYSCEELQFVHDYADRARKDVSRIFSQLAEALENP